MVLISLICFCCPGSRSQRYQRVTDRTIEKDMLAGGYKLISQRLSLLSILRHVVQTTQADAEFHATHPASLARCFKPGIIKLASADMQIHHDQPPDFHWREKHYPTQQRVDYATDEYAGETAVTVY